MGGIYPLNLLISLSKPPPTHPTIRHPCPTASGAVSVYSMPPIGRLTCLLNFGIFHTQLRNITKSLFMTIQDILQLSRMSDTKSKFVVLVDSSTG